MEENIEKKAPPSIYIKSSKEEKDEFRKIAKIYGLSVAELVRRAVRLVERERPELYDVAKPSQTPATS